jgi:hypothetical protein
VHGCCTQPAAKLLLLLLLLLLRVIATSAADIACQLFVGSHASIHVCQVHAP